MQKINIYIDGVRSRLEYTDFSINQIYDKYYINSDQTKNADFWEEVIIRSSGEKLVSLRKI